MNFTGTPPQPQSQPANPYATMPRGELLAERERLAREYRETVLLLEKAKANPYETRRALALDVCTRHLVRELVMVETAITGRAGRE